MGAWVAFGLIKSERGGGGRKNGRGNSICARKPKSISETDTSDGFGKNAPVYHEYPVIGTTSEERAKCSRGGVGANGVF